MTEEQQAPDQDATAEEDPRKQLWVRASVAGGLIGLLLGGLALFDHLSRPPAPAEIVLPTKPIAPAQVAPETGRDAPPEVVRAGEAVESVPPEAAPATSEGSAPPILPEGERAERVGRIGEGTRPLARPPVSAGGAPAPAPRSVAAPAVSAPVAAVPAPVGAVAPVSRPAGVVPAPSAPAPAPAATAALPAPAPAAAVAGKVEAAPRYVLHFGMFSSVATAEDLRARLAQAGIPSQLETRVVVGPFADRRDALAAQARLREKGIDAGTLQPFGR